MKVCYMPLPSLLHWFHPLIIFPKVIYCWPHYCTVLSNIALLHPSKF
jgi:hypothetical protein